MSIRSGHESSRDAETFFEVIERFAGYAYLRVKPKTGPNPSIRVHLAHIGIPVLCDDCMRSCKSHSRAMLRKLALVSNFNLATRRSLWIDKRSTRIAFASITDDWCPTGVPSPASPDFEETLKTLREQNSRPSNILSETPRHTSNAASLRDLHTHNLQAHLLTRHPTTP